MGRTFDVVASSRRPQLQIGQLKQSSWLNNKPIIGCNGRPLAFSQNQADFEPLVPLVPFLLSSAPSHKPRLGLGLGCRRRQRQKGKGLRLSPISAHCVGRAAVGAPRQLCGVPTNMRRLTPSSPPSACCIALNRSECLAGHAPPERSGRWQRSESTCLTGRLHMKSRSQSRFSLNAWQAAESNARMPALLPLPPDVFRRQVDWQKYS